jgi:hypothetical protein
MATKTYRIIICIAITLVIVKTSVLDYEQGMERFVKNAFGFFEDSQEVAKYWDLIAIGNLIHYLLIFLVGISLYRINIRLSSEKRRLVNVIYPISSFGLAWLLSKIDYSINPYFFLHYPAPIKTEILSLFNHTVLRNFIEIIAVWPIVQSIRTIEIVFVHNGKVLNRLKSLPSKTYFINTIIPLGILILITSAGLKEGIQAVTLLLSLLLVLTGFLGLLGTSLTALLSIERTIKPLRSYLKVYLIYSGVVMAYLVFLIFPRMEYGDFFISDLTDPQLFFIFILGLVPILSGSLAFQIQKDKIEHGLKLNAVQAQLDSLKSQINPHFLFNSLNSIYGTAIAEQSPKTAEGVQKLSEMMRFMLKENTEDKISLAKEINYINNYIDLQRLRVDENEKIQIEVVIDEACQAEITPMLLIPFIENAFKHGISMSRPSWIDIKLACTSETLSLEVKNSIHKKQFSQADESGIGLENVKERLKLLYAEKHKLEIHSDEKTYFVGLNLTLT